MKTTMKALCLGVLFFAAPVMMGTNYARAQEKVSIGFDASNPPFMYDANGEVKGIYPALISAVFDEIKLPLQTHSAPWGRVLAGVDSGQNGVGGIYKNAEREKKYDFSAPLYEEQLVLYVKADKTFAFNGLDDLKGKVLGVIRGWSYGDAFDKARVAGTFTAEDVDSDAMNVKKLNMSRVDALIGEPKAVGMILAKEGLTGKIVALPTPVTTNTTYVAFAKSAHMMGTIDAFNTGLAALRADGRYEATINAATK